MKAQSRARKILSGEVSRDRTWNSVVESCAPIRVVANGDPVRLETRSRVARKHTIVFLFRIGKEIKPSSSERERGGERGRPRLRFLFQSFLSKPRFLSLLFLSPSLIFRSETERLSFSVCIIIIITASNPPSLAPWSSPTPSPRSRTCPTRC